MYKIKFPSGYQVNDFENDNIDIHIILDTGDVFFGTLFTILNIENLFKKDEFNLYFWSTDMLILKDLKLDTIRKAIDSLIDEEKLNAVFSKIGDVNRIYKTDFNSIS